MGNVTSKKRIVPFKEARKRCKLDRFEVLYVPKCGCSDKVLQAHQKSFIDYKKVGKNFKLTQVEDQNRNQSVKDYLFEKFWDLEYHHKSQDKFSKALIDLEKEISHLMITFVE
jgi:hypothetical protein